MTTRTAVPRPRGAAHARRLGALAGAAAILLGGSFAAAGPASADSSHTLTVASATEISTFNPFTAYFDGELNILGSIYPSLTQLDASGNPQPYLAESWTTSNDKLTWTFKIRKGLKWTDGQPITAKDAAFTLNLIMTNQDAAKANGSLVSNFDSVSAPDDSTLVVKTKTAQANMLYVSVPVNGIPIVPEHVWSAKVSGIKDEKNMSFPVVGYGPWILTGYQTDQYATMEANKDFYEGKPKYDKLVTEYFKNSDAAVAALKSGQVQEVSGVTATQYQALSGAKDIQTIQQIGHSWKSIEVNSGAKTQNGTTFGTGNPALADEKVRQAIAYSIDRQTLVSKVFNGLGVPGAGYLPPAYPQFTWTPSADATIGFDQAKAGQLLDQAGYPKGADGMRVGKDGKPLTLRLGTHSDSTTDAQTAEYVVGWLKTVGVTVEVQPMSMTVLNDNLSKGDWDMLFDGWGTGPDPTYLLGIQTCNALPTDPAGSSSTDAFYCNPDYDKLFNQQVAEFDATKRAAIIGQMQDLLYKANADIVLYYPNGLSAVRTDQTTGFFTGKPDSKGFYPLQDVFLEWQNATPAGGSSSSNNLAIYGGAGGAVVVVGALATFLLMRRRGTAQERE